MIVSARISLVTAKRILYVKTFVSKIVIYLRKILTITVIIFKIISLMQYQ